MPDKIKINEEQGIIEIRSYGIISKSDIDNSIKETSEIFNKTGINKILVNTIEQESMPGTFNIYELFANFPRDLVIALVTNREQPTLEDIRFAETVAHNRSIRVKIFSSRDEAVLWLNNN